MGKLSRWPNTRVTQENTQEGPETVLSLDISPAAGRANDNTAMIELFLDILSQMHVMKEYMVQHEQADRDQAQKDDAVKRSSPRLATMCEGRSLETK